MRQWTGAGLAVSAAAVVAVPGAPVGAVAYPAGCTADGSLAGNPQFQNNCWVGPGYDTSGSYVAAVQNVIQGWLSYAGCVDGSYGSGTRDAVRSYQAANSLAADGIVGTNTWKTLGQDLNFEYASSDGERYYYSAGFGGSVRFHDYEGHMYTQAGSCAGGAWKQMQL